MLWCSGLWWWWPGLWCFFRQSEKLDHFTGWLNECKCVYVQDISVTLWDPVSLFAWKLLLIYCNNKKFFWTKLDVAIHVSNYLVCDRNTILSEMSSHLYSSAYWFFFPLTFLLPASSPLFFCALFSSFQHHFPLL